MTAKTTRLADAAIRDDNVEIATRVCLTLRRTADKFGNLALEADGFLGGFVRPIRIIIF